MGYTFSPQTTYATGADPVSVTTADVNGDGHADLVVANANSNTVSVLLGTGTGTFAAQTTYATGPDPISVTTADVNGDGHADLMVANANSNTVSVLLGTGTGTFAAQTTTAIGPNPSSVTTADVNGDGHPDLVVTISHNTVSVLLGTGTGTFAAQTTYATGDGPISVTTADVNGDGHADLVVANFISNTVSVLLGTGTGTFGAQTTYATGSNPESVTTADVNGDGHPDLVVANVNDDTVSVLLGTGTGTFAAQTTYATGDKPVSVTTADVNSDGHPDLVVANFNSATVSVLLGTGTGTFAAQTTYATGTGPFSVTTADVNGDGHPDLVVANAGSNTVSVLLGALSNSPPVAGGAGNTIGYTEQAVAATVDIGLTVSDPDNLNLASATVTISNGLQSGDTLHFSNQNGITGSFSAGVLTLSGSASLANYQTALDSVTFDNPTNDNPTNFGNNPTRTITWMLNDGSASNNLSVAVTTNITINPVNDAPVAANSNAGAREDQSISGLVSATDVDNTPAQLSYSLVGTNGGAAHGTVVLHGDGSYTYIPVQDFNGSDSFSFKANDGLLDSNVATESLTIAAVNDPPANTIPGSLNAFNNLDTAIAGLAVSDPDAVSLTTTLHLDHGTLTVAAVGGATVGGSGTSTVTLTGSVAQINATLGAANNVVYHSEAGFTGTDHLTMTSNDGGGTGIGGPLTDTDIANIFVTASNAPPHRAFGVFGGASANSPAPSPQGPSAASILNDGFLFPSQPDPAPASNPVISFFTPSDPASSHAADGSLHLTPLISSIPDVDHPMVNSFNPPHLTSDFHIA